MLTEYPQNYQVHFEKERHVLRIKKITPSDAGGKGEGQASQIHAPRRGAGQCKSIPQPSLGGGYYYLMQSTARRHGASGPACHLHEPCLGWTHLSLCECTTNRQSQNKKKQVFVWGEVVGIQFLIPTKCGPHTMMSRMLMKLDHVLGKHPGPF